MDIKFLCQPISLNCPEYFPGWYREICFTSGFLRIATAPMIIVSIPIIWDIFLTNPTHFAFFQKTLLELDLSILGKIVYSSRSYIFLIKNEASIPRILKWHNSLDQRSSIWIGNNRAILISSWESLLLFRTPTFPYIIYFIHFNISFF